MIKILLLLWLPQLYVIKRNSLFYSIVSDIYIALYFYGPHTHTHSLSSEIPVVLCYGPNEFEFRFPQYQRLSRNTLEDSICLRAGGNSPGILAAALNGIQSAAKATASPRQ